MRLRAILLLAPLVFLSCSKRASEARHEEPVKPSPAVPFKISVVNTPEALEQAQIKERALTLLTNKEYAELERWTQEYQTSKASYADGAWKIGFVYDGLASHQLTATEAWEERQKQLQAWMDAKPESSAARIAMARFLRNYAWEARGGGWADSVTDDGWRLFGQRLNRAWSILDQLSTRDDAGPYYWSTRMGVALGLQADKRDFELIFVRALKAEPDYHSFYMTRAIFLLPRWYGEEGEWQRDLKASADRVGGEQGDLIYAQTVWSIHQYGCSIDVFEGKDAVSWDRIERGFGLILKLFPNSLAARSERAYLACLAGEKDKARAYFVEIDGKVDPSIWGDQDGFTRAANWAFAP